MKHAYLLLLAAGLFAASCKKENTDVAVPHRPPETLEEKAKGTGFSLTGGYWVITPSIMRHDQIGYGPDAYAFPTDSTYGRLMLGDIGESGKYKAVAQSGTATVTFEMAPERSDRRYYLLIEKISYRYIRVNGLNFFRKER
ncbi:hypothetical protein ACFOTA_09645 [Chitinophaga sp. GCM10012297]|uniref:Uncharacterized protein n=1 Tax=Chitinophaga chungangae TaxID=2821488 RepID=A0ABS3YCP9_9BACT|nr:hypothetical protein [Chitinophaga chungangae]MBO9152467.1 hypothetical protein [Chitinophaga chungangae]